MFGEPVMTTKPMTDEEKIMNDKDIDDLGEDIKTSLKMWSAKGFSHHQYTSKQLDEVFEDIILPKLAKAKKKWQDEARVDEWQRACRDNWQKPIPEQYALDRLKSLTNKE